MLVGERTAPEGDRMPQCNNCTEEIATEDDTHVVVVKPMEFKGSQEQIEHYYCSVKCLVERAKA